MADDDQSNEERPVAPPRRGHIPGWLIAVVIVGVLSVLFISQNRRRVRVDFVIFDRFARTWVVILISMALGALLVELIRLGMRRRRGGTD